MRGLGAREASEFFPRRPRGGERGMVKAMTRSSGSIITGFAEAVIRSLELIVQPDAPRRPLGEFAGRLARLALGPVYAGIYQFIIVAKQRVRCVT